MTKENAANGSLSRSALRYLGLAAKAAKYTCIGQENRAAQIILETDALWFQLSQEDRFAIGELIDSTEAP